MALFPVAAYWGPQNAWNTGRSGPENNQLAAIRKFYQDSTNLCQVYEVSEPNDELLQRNINWSCAIIYFTKHVSREQKIRRKSWISCFLPALHRYGSAIFHSNKPSSNHPPHLLIATCENQLWKFVGIRWPQALDMKKLTRGPNLFYEMIKKWHLLYLCINIPI